MVVRYAVEVCGAVGAQIVARVYTGEYKIDLKGQQFVLN